jgi:hypothetical protein
VALHIAFAYESSRIFALRDGDRQRRLVGMAPLPSSHLAGVTLRAARPDDAPAVARLASLDSRRLPAGPFLLAEENGVPRAALSLSTGATIADPFAPTDHLLTLLRRHAARRTAPPGWHGNAARVRSRLPRLALRAG